MVTTLFENEDLRLSSTGHDYDFVGTIEVLNDKPLTFFFAEALCQVIDDDGTKYVLHYNDYDHVDFFTQSKEDGWKGFLSDPKERGWFLALVKNYCPEQMKNIPWA